jgi:predicted phosphodiesterase
MTAENVLICGHTHEAWSRQYGPRLVVNPGSVGLHFNRNRGAEYAMLVWTGTQWIAEHRELTMI